jgi:DNA-directed RNA polymerase subunit RPC12/RpoP
VSEPEPVDLKNTGQIGSLEFTAEGISDEKLNFSFRCMKCGGTIISLPDNHTDDSIAVCKACGVLFGPLAAIKARMAVVAQRAGYVVRPNPSSPSAPSSEAAEEVAMLKEEAAVTAGMGMAWMVDNSLKIARETRDVSTRIWRVQIAKDNVRRLKDNVRQLKELSVEHPVLQLTTIAVFENSIRAVEEETAAILNVGSLTRQSDATNQPTARQSIPLRIRKVAELIGSEVVLSKQTNPRPRDFAEILTSLEPVGSYGLSGYGYGPRWCFRVLIGEGKSARDLVIDLAPFVPIEEYERSLHEPIFVGRENDAKFVIFRGRFFLPERNVVTSDEFEEVIIRAKKLVYDEEGELFSLRAAVSNQEAAIEFQRNGPKREPISDDVKMLVWSRDGAACVRCGATERLHFDHIIPVVKGGSSEAVNIQLLCQPCNLKKSDKIAF